MTTDRKRVSQYLALIKFYASNEFIILSRAKNIDFLLSLGIDFETAKDVFMSLKTCNYIDGPCKDDKDIPGRHDVWIFGKTLRASDGNDVETYIKVTHSQAKKGLGCICISFHEAEWPLKYRFGGEQREIYILP